MDPRAPIYTWIHGYIYHHGYIAASHGYHGAQGLMAEISQPSPPPPPPRMPQLKIDRVRRCWWLVVSCGMLWPHDSSMAGGLWLLEELQSTMADRENRQDYPITGDWKLANQESPPSCLWGPSRIRFKNRTSILDRRFRREEYVWHLFEWKSIDEVSRTCMHLHI